MKNDGTLMHRKYKYLTNVNELRDLRGPESFLPHVALLANSNTSKNEKMRFTCIFDDENSTDLTGGKQKVWNSLISIRSSCNEHVSNPCHARATRGPRVQS